jgi:hypothetical protein
MTTTSRATAMPAAASTRRLAGYAAGGLAAAAFVIIVGNWNVAPGEHGGTGPAVATGVFCLVVAGILFGLVVPRTRRAGRTTVVLGVVAVLSLVVFWSGVTPVIAAAAVAVPADPAAPDRRVVPARALAVGSTLLVLAWTILTVHHV